MAHVHKLISVRNAMQDSGIVVEHALQVICSRLKGIVDVISTYPIALSVISKMENAGYVKLVNFLLKMDKHVAHVLKKYLCVVFARIHLLKIHNVICAKMVCSHRMANNAEHAILVTACFVIH